jgi:hypothetical protein
MGLIAANPMAPPLPNIQHREVQLTAGEEDWSQVLTTAEANLQTVAGEAATANSDLSSAISTELSGFGTQISTALAGAESGVQNSIDGGWYGSDDGYVFGLLGGSVTNPATGITETGSTLQEISGALDQGNVLNAFSYFDAWSLETLDHTMKPLLSTLLTETDDNGVTTQPVPAELLQTLTNTYEAFANYDFLRLDLVQPLLAPEIDVAFGLSTDLDRIASDLSSGSVDQALTDIGNLPSDLTGDILNGWTDPAAGTGLPFPGLLNSGSLLEELLATWPTQLATALGESTTPGSADAIASTVPDLVGLLSF